MGDVHQNQLPPEGQKNTSSRAANYPKAYSSFSPVIPDTIKGNEKKVIEELERLLSTFDSLERSAKSRKDLNKSHSFVSSSIEGTRDVHYDLYSVLLLINNSRKKLQIAKKTGDVQVMVKAFTEQCQTANLVSNYLEQYGVNMEIGATNWIAGLNWTKTISFAIASASGAILAGGSLLAGTVAGGAAGLVDSELTEASMYYNDLSNDIPAALGNVFLKTASGALFGFVGGVIGAKVPGLSEIASSTNELMQVLNLTLNSSLNFGIGKVESFIWDLIGDAAGEVVDVKRIDFDYTIPYKIYSYILHKQALLLSPDIQYDDNTHKYKYDSSLISYKLNEELRYSNMGEYRNNPNMQPTFRGKTLVNNEEYEGNSRLAAFLNLEKETPQEIINECFEQFDRLGKQLSDTLTAILNLSDELSYAHNSPYISIINGRYFNSSTSNYELDSIKNKDSAKYRNNNQMQLTYDGKVIIPDNQRYKNEMTVAVLNNQLIPLLNKTVSLFVSMFAYISASVNALTLE